MYRRSRNFRVKYISPFNFLRRFIFVTRAHRRKLNHAKILFTFPGPDTMSHHWRGAGVSDQCKRGNAADTHAVLLIERVLPSATYLQRVHLSVSVSGSNCLQKFASAIAHLGSAIFQDPGHYRQVSGSAAEPYLYFDSRKLLSRIINYSTLKIFRVFNFVVMQYRRQQKFPDLRY